MQTVVYLHHPIWSAWQAPQTGQSSMQPQTLAPLQVPLP